MQIVIGPEGSVTCLYTEAVDLAALGRLQIRRASVVEVSPSGQWWSDLGPVGGPKLGPFDRRSLALAAEVAWLERYVASNLVAEDRSLRRMDAGTGWPDAHGVDVGTDWMSGSPLCAVASGLEQPPAGDPSSGSLQR